MQTDNKWLDDVAKAATGALGSVAGLKQEIEARVQQQVDRWLGRMNLVSREEFEAVKAMVQTARSEQIRLERRLAALEHQSDQQKHEPGEAAAPGDSGSTR